MMLSSSGYFWWSEPLWQALLVLLIGALCLVGGSIVAIDVRGVSDRLVHRRTANIGLRFAGLVVALFGIYLLVAQSVGWAKGFVA